MQDCMSRSGKCQKARLPSPFPSLLDVQRLGRAAGTGHSAHQHLYLVLTAIAQERDLVAGQDLSIQRHLPHAPVGAGCFVRGDLENGFAVAVRHLVTRPTKPGKVADKPAKLRSCVWSHV
jgi:hypothetical protein